MELLAKTMEEAVRLEEPSGFCCMVVIHGYPFQSPDLFSGTKHDCGLLISCMQFQEGLHVIRSGWFILKKEV